MFLRVEVTHRINLDDIDIELDGTHARVWSVFASVGRNTPGHVATMHVNPSCVGIAANERAGRI